MQIKAIATIFGLVAATMAAPHSPPFSDDWSSDSDLSDSDPTGNRYGNPYGNPYDNPYGNPYDNPYGNPHGNPHGNPFHHDKEKTYGDGNQPQDQKQSVTQIVKVDNSDKEYANGAAPPPVGGTCPAGSFTMCCIPAGTTCAPAPPGGASCPEAGDIIFCCQTTAVSVLLQTHSMNMT
jgi:hypothetical protein